MPKSLPKRELPETVMTTIRMNRRVMHEGRFYLGMEGTNLSKFCSKMLEEFIIASRKKYAADIVGETKNT